VAEERSQRQAVMNRLLDAALSARVEALAPAHGGPRSTSSIGCSCTSTRTFWSGIGSWRGARGECEAPVATPADCAERASQSHIRADAWYSPIQSDFQAFAPDIEAMWAHDGAA
jgi:hypothetical protein